MKESAKGRFFENYIGKDSNKLIWTVMWTQKPNLPKKGFLSLAILAICSLTRTLQLMGFGKNRQINRHTDIATYILNRPRGLFSEKYTKISDWVGHPVSFGQCFQLTRKSNVSAQNYIELNTSVQSFYVFWCLRLSLTATSNTLEAPSWKHGITSCVV